MDVLYVQVGIIMHVRLNNIENICIKCGNCMLTTLPLEDLALSFYLVMNVPGIQTMSLNDS